MIKLTWRRVGPQDYQATLPDGRPARVTGVYVDDRDYDGGNHGWQWTAWIGSQSVDGVTHRTKGDATEALNRALRVGTPEPGRE